MALYTPKTHCRLCASGDLELVLDLGLSPIGEDFILPAQQAKEQPLFPLTLTRCTACGHVQLGEVIDKNSVYTDYLYETTRSLGLDKHFEAYADTVMALPNVQQGQWAVDIGSNAGTLLHALARRGLQVQGVEPAKRIAQNALHNGIPTECCYFDSNFSQRFCAAHGQASVITANNVFANIDNLESVLTAVTQLLQTDGYFIVETGYALDLVQNFVIDNIYHEHISYFLLGPLVKYFAQHGLRIVRADRIPTKGGSVRVYAQHMSCKAKADWSVEGLVRLEQELMFPHGAPYKIFAQNAATRRIQARESIEKRLSCGPMAAFGAAVGCTTMLYWLGIVEHIEYIVDDNTLMHGRLSPHAHIPVLPPEALYTRKPATLVNLPWRYLGAIMQKHKTYMEQGGHIAQLLPNTIIY